MTLRELRQAIDEVDDKLVALLNERARLALEVGRWKRARQKPVYDPGRESQVLARARRRTRTLGGPLDEGAIARVFERVIDEARQVEMTDAEAREPRAGSRNDGRRHGRTLDRSADRARRRLAR